MVNFTLPAAPEVDRNEVDPNEEDSDDEYHRAESQEVDSFKDGTTIQQLEEKIVQGICRQRKDSSVHWSI
jgi:hypothetical protein